MLEYDWPASRQLTDPAKVNRNATPIFLGKQMFGRLVLALPTAVAVYFATKFGIHGLGFSAFWPLVAALAIWLMMALILPSS